MDLYLATTELQLVTCINLIVNNERDFELILTSDRTQKFYQRLAACELFKGRTHKHSTEVMVKSRQYDRIFGIYDYPLQRSFEGQRYIIDEGTFSYLPIALQTKPVGAYLYDKQLAQYDCPTFDLPKLTGNKCLPYLTLLFQQRKYENNYCMWVDSSFTSPFIEQLVVKANIESVANRHAFIRRVHPALENINGERSNCPLELEFLFGRPLPSKFYTVNSSGALYYRLLMDCNYVSTDVYYPLVENSVDSLVSKYFKGLNWKPLKDWFIAYQRKYGCNLIS